MKSDTDVYLVHDSYYDRVNTDSLEFGGILGAVLTGSVRACPQAALCPELVAGVGISGAKAGLGARWSIITLHEECAFGETKFAYDDHLALIPRAIAYYRWADERSRPAFWHGVTTRDGWYLGGEIGLDVFGGAFTLALTWDPSHHSNGQVTLAYGIGAW